METKWTPGPWKAVNLDDDTIFPSVVLHEVASRRPARITINEGPSREMIEAGGSYGGTTIETASANARLIAAAPDFAAASLSTLDRLGGLPDWLRENGADMLAAIMGDELKKHAAALIKAGGVAP